MFEPSGKFYLSCRVVPYTSICRALLPIINCLFVPLNPSSSPAPISCETSTPPHRLCPPVQTNLSTTFPPNGGPSLLRRAYTNPLLRFPHLRTQTCPFILFIFTSRTQLAGLAYLGGCRVSYRDKIWFDCVSGIEKGDGFRDGK